MFAAITCVPFLFPTKINSSLNQNTALLSLSAPSQNVVVSVPSLYSSLSGLPLSTTLLPAGLGILMAGQLFSAASTLQVVLQYISALVPPRWPSHCISANDVDMVQRDWLINLKTRVMSFSALYCFGLDGSGSMEVQLWEPISELSRLASLQIWQLRLVV
jgi:hypothetical protein